MGIIRNKEKSKKELFFWKLFGLIYLIGGTIFIYISIVSYCSEIVSNLFFKGGIVCLVLSIIGFINISYWNMKLSIIEIVGEATRKENK